MKGGMENEHLFTEGGRRNLLISTVSAGGGRNTALNRAFPRRETVSRYEKGRGKDVPASAARFGEVTARR